MLMKANTRSQTGSPKPPANCRTSGPWTRRGRGQVHPVPLRRYPSAGPNTPPPPARAGQGIEDGVGTSLRRSLPGRGAPNHAQPCPDAPIGAVARCLRGAARGGGRRGVHPAARRAAGARGVDARQAESFDQAQGHCPEPARKCGNRGVGVGMRPHLRGSARNRTPCASDPLRGAGFTLHWPQDTESTPRVRPEGLGAEPGIMTAVRSSHAMARRATNI